MSMKCARCQRHIFRGDNFCISCGIHVDTIDAESKRKTVMLWRLLGPGDVIQPGDTYSSSLTGGQWRCTPDMMGKRLPYMAMPHLRPAGTRTETIP